MTLTKAKVPLSESHPELAAQWHPTKNGALRPDQGGSGVKGKTKKDLFWDKFFQGFQSAVPAVSDLRGQVTPR